MTMTVQELIKYLLKQVDNTKSIVLINGIKSFTIEELYLNNKEYLNFKIKE